MTDAIQKKTQQESKENKKKIVSSSLSSDLMKKNYGKATEFTMDLQLPSNNVKNYWNGIINNCFQT